MEAMELGLLQTQEVVSHGREESIATQESVQRDLDTFGQRINNIFNMLSKLPQFSLPEDFPPRSTTDPILPSNGIIHRASGLQEAEDLPILEPKI